MLIEKAKRDIILELSTLVTYVKTSGLRNLLSPNIASEKFYAKFFNEMMKWELEAMNTDKCNVEAIDLEDRKNKIIVQVTSNKRMRKLDASIKAIDVPKYKGYRYCYIVISEQAKNLKKNKERVLKNIQFNPSVDIWDVNAIIGRLDSSDYEPETIFALANIVNRYLAFNSKPKMKSYISQVVMSLVRKIDEEQPDFDETNIDFSIEHKIEYNELEDRRNLIATASAFSSQIQEVYDECIKSGKNAFYYISYRMKKTLDTAPSCKTSCELYDLLIDRITEEVDIVDENTKEEIEMCVCAIIADAFMKCKIFKKPKA